jgi:hypothetical protein
MRMNANRRVPADGLRAIDEILWRLWDPIGVNDMPEARDEYSSYAPGILGLLRRGADDEEIARHLRMIESERMGLHPTSPAERLRAVLSALRDVALPSSTGP